MTYEWEIIPREYEKPVQSILRRIRGITGNMWKQGESVALVLRDAAAIYVAENRHSGARACSAVECYAMERY